MGMRGRRCRFDGRLTLQRSCSETEDMTKNVLKPRETVETWRLWVNKNHTVEIFRCSDNQLAW